MLERRAPSPVLRIWGLLERHSRWGESHDVIGKSQPGWEKGMAQGPYSLACAVCVDGGPPREEAEARMGSKYCERPEASAVPAGPSSAPHDLDHDRLVLRGLED